MKRKGAEGIPARQQLAPAANEEFTGLASDLIRPEIGRRELDRVATPRSGWDPYEVWLKRVKQPREHDIVPASRPVVATEPRDMRYPWLRMKPHA